MMYHHPPVLRIIGVLVWLVTAIGALNWGLEAYGYNLFHLHFVETNLAHLVTPFKYIVGVCGALSIAMLVEKLINHDEKCNCR
ncbi:MAG: hypothetical protein WC707_04935 [Candidatus Babeliaceae bacterium]|jgi:uncharacterized membrane protein YuzA (DUF378 family)